MALKNHVNLKLEPFKRLMNFSSVAALLMAGLSLSVLAGWQLGIEPLKRISTGWVAMNPMTAVAFLLSGIALLLSCRPHSVSARSLRIARILAMVVVVFGLINLIRCLGGPDLHIDQVLFNLNAGASHNADFGIRSTRVAPNTALLFILFGIALLLSHLNRTWWRIAGKAVATIGSFIAIVGILGYLNGVTTLYRPTMMTPMALHTALGFLLFAASLLSFSLRTGPAQPDLPDEEDLFPVHRKMALGFAASLFVLAVIGIVCLASLQSLVSANDAAAKGHQILESVARLSAILSDAETGERGYVLTENEAFLEPYHAAIRDLQPQIDELEQLVADEPVHREQFTRMIPVIQQELDFFRRVIEGVRAHGVTASESLVASGEGKKHMDAVRGYLRAMREHETAIQSLQAAEVQRTSSITVAVVSSGTLLAFLLVGLAGWRIRHDLIQKQLISIELRNARRNAEDANESKSRFLANMSHEIRTPMAAIIGYTDLVLDPTQSPSDRIDHINTIRRNGQHLLTLINDILDLSKIESGKFAIERVSCCPCRVLSDVASLMRIRAIEKNIRLTVNNDGPIPASVHTDPVRLRQILINLVGNAIKFTDEGFVKLIMKLEEPEDAPARLRFDIIDTGVGMDGEQLQQLFKPFVQADTSSTRRFGGTGLGLTISRHLAEMLGGSITVDSFKGRGATFTAIIDPGDLRGVQRLNNCSEALAGIEAASPDSQVTTLSANVLLVDDGDDNRRLLSVYLRTAGVNVTLAENGRIGADKAIESLADGKPFDLIIMDMQMPVLDGYSAAALLRAKGYTAPIIALTANAMAEDRNKCLSAGCTDYLSKPVRREKLLALIAHYVHGKIADPDPSASPSVSSGTGTIHSDLSDQALRPLLRTYVNELPDKVNQLASLVQQNDLDALAEMVHNFKGTGGLYGLMPISDAATGVEEQLLRKAPLEAIRSAVDELIATIRRVEGFPASAADSPTKSDEVR